MKSEIQTRTLTLYKLKIKYIILVNLVMLACVIGSCGSGQGMVMTANRYKEVRAAICWKKGIAELAWQHNNANVLCLPARSLSLDEATEIVEAFLETEFEGGRHQNRIDKISVLGYE